MELIKIMLTKIAQVKRVSTEYIIFLCNIDYEMKKLTLN